MRDSARLTRPGMRRPTPLGILLGVDDGLLQCIPGSPPERGIDGPQITSVDARGGLAIAGAPGDGGAWVHAGVAWRRAWSGDVRTVQIGVHALYLGTGDGRLLHSIDEGEAWTELEGTRSLRHDGDALPPRPAPPAVTGVVEVRSGLVVAFEGGGTWFTGDQGASWFRRDEGIDRHVLHLYRHPDVERRLYVTTRSGLYRSGDEGYTWIQSLTDLDRAWCGSLAVLPGPTDALVLSLARSASGVGALFRSTNGGGTWSRVLLEGEDEWARVPAVVRPHELEDVAFVAAGSRLYASHDRGHGWTCLADGLPLVNAVEASV